MKLLSQSVQTKPQTQTKDQSSSASSTQDSDQNQSISYPEHIPESQGDLADRAEVEIEQELQEQIFRAIQSNRKKKPEAQQKPQT